MKCESYIDSSSCSESIKANESVYCYESLIDDVSSKDDTKNRQEFDVNYKLLYENEKQISNLQNAEIKNMKRLLRNAQRVNQRRAKTISIKKRNVRILRNEVKRLYKEKATDVKLRKLLESNSVVYNSIMNALKKPKGRRYDKQTKTFSIGAYLAGPAAFRYVQSTKVLNLPSKMSIRRWNADVMMTSCLNISLLDRLAKKCLDFSKKERAVTICIDGMSIKQELVYNAKTDTFFGFPFDGNKRKFEKKQNKHAYYRSCGNNGVGYVSFRAISYKNR